MPEDWTRLPPLEWVRVFEAAGRLGSFTAAAVELGLTQAAVSQRIGNLERRLGTQLFERRARGVTLSIQGEAWLPHVQGALGQLANSTANLFAAPRRKVTVAASSSVIELWIAPRLPAIRQALPHLQLAFETIQRIPDYARSDGDLDIRFGNGSWPDLDARRLYEEELAPLASPDLMRDGARDWRTLPLIATAGPRSGWTDWAIFAGIPPLPTPVLRFDTFAQAVAAAQAGAGVLLGSLALCRASLEAGRLVRLTPEAMRMDGGYWITWPRSRPRYRERDVLVDILTAEAGDR